MYISISKGVTAWRIRRTQSDDSLEDGEQSSSDKVSVSSEPCSPLNVLPSRHQFILKTKKMARKRILVPAVALIAMSLLNMISLESAIREAKESVVILMTIGGIFPAKKGRKRNKFEMQRRPSRAQKYPYSPWDTRQFDNDSFTNRAINEVFAIQRPLHILSLGGSITWGGSLTNRFDAYPVLLTQLHQDSTIDNLAIRASGANFPSNCIQSMVDGDAFPELENFSDGSRNEKVYNLILLEFSINGFRGTEFLLQRLRRRYPDAVIMYVHLESLHYRNNQLAEEEVRNIMRSVDGIYYMFPNQVPVDVVNGSWGEETLKLFDHDMHHLSEVGHKLVAGGIISTLYKELVMYQNNFLKLAVGTLGTWGAGDQCYIWLTGGEFPKKIRAGGGKFVNFDKFLNKFAYEIETGSTATFSFVRNEFNLPDSTELPIHILHMSKMTESYSLYPQARIETNGIMSAFVSNDFDQFSRFHVAKPMVAGISKEGENVISIEPVQETERPFRLVGIMICGACVEGPNTGMQDMTIRIPEISFLNPS